MDNVVPFTVITGPKVSGELAAEDIEAIWANALENARGTLNPELFLIVGENDGGRVSIVLPSEDFDRIAMIGVLSAALHVLINNT